MNCCYKSSCVCTCGRRRRCCDDIIFTERSYSRGSQTTPGPVGPIGPQGPQGIPGGIISYSDFYATMPTDNPAPITAGGDIAFPSTAAISPTGIARAADSAVTLAAPGTYFISFSATPTEAAQLVLTLNGAELPYTVTGSGVAGGELKGSYLVTTTTPNSTVTLRNPATATTPITLTASAGGTDPVTAHLTVLRVA